MGRCIKIQNIFYSAVLYVELYISLLAMFYKRGFYIVFKMNIFFLQICLYPNTIHIVLFFSFTPQLLKDLCNHHNWSYRPNNIKNLLINVIPKARLSSFVKFKTYKKCQTMYLYNILFSNTVDLFLFRF